MGGPLDGMRVLELATGVAGPYAGRLLSMLGATVVKVEPAGGDIARTMRVDDRPLTTDVSPLFAYLNAGKTIVPVGGVGVSSESAVAWADVVIDSRVAREVAGSWADPRGRSAESRGVFVSVTAWGYEARDAGDPRDELIVQAASGLMGETAEPGREPLRFPGWQAQYLAGGYAAAAALAALGDGVARHVDIRWVNAVLSGVEGEVAQYLHRVTGTAVASPPTAPGQRDPQAALQAGAYPAGAFRCKDGYVVPGSVRPLDWTLQCAIYDRPDLLEDARFDVRNRNDHREALAAEIQPWYDAHTKQEIFRAALDTGWAAAMVMNASDTIADEHIDARGFLGPLSGIAGGEGAVAPSRPWRSASVDDRAPFALTYEPDAGPIFGFSRVTGTDSGPLTLEKPKMPDLRGLRVIELTWAWAGPFVGRFLGAWGADVIRVEAGRYPDGWRRRMRWKDAGCVIPDGADPNGYTWDAAALHNGLNRNKRSVSVDLTQPEGRDVFVALLDHADVMIVNMSHQVLADRGIEDDVRAASERGLVLVNMPALGATGPYKSMPGYGMLMEAMGGFAARYGYLDEGARTTSNYYPDAVAGLHGTVAALAGLAERQRTGADR